MLKEVIATRYITPLREGGSLPGLVEADDFGTYVLKFTGAGQGRKTLVAEVVCGELARRLGFRVPRLVTVDVDPVLGLGEPEQQVQELLRSSGGTNLGMDFLSGALASTRSPSRWIPPRPGGSSGSTRWSTTSTAPGATPTCCAGAATCGSSTTAPP